MSDNMEKEARELWAMAVGNDQSVEVGKMSAYLSRFSAICEKRGMVKAYRDAAKVADPYYNGGDAADAILAKAAALQSELDSAAKPEGEAR